MWSCLGRVSLQIYRYIYLQISKISKWDHPGFRVILHKSNSICPCKRKIGTQRRSHVRWRQGLEWRTCRPGNAKGARAGRKAQNTFSVRVSGRSTLLTPWLWTSGLQNYMKINLCWFKLLNLCQFVTTGPRNEHIAWQSSAEPRGQMNLTICTERPRASFPEQSVTRISPTQPFAFVWD